MITLDLSILNQKGTPMFNSDLFANRPAAGIVGRIFISTDTQTIFRDTGTTWDTIGGGGGTIGGSIATGQVAFGTAANTIGGNNNLFWDNTNGRLGIGIATPNVSLDVRRSGISELAYFVNTALNAGLIIGTQTNIGYITSTSSLSSLGFGINGGTSAMRIFTTSNVLINTTIDAGQRLQVAGNVAISSTANTTSLSIAGYSITGTSSNNFIDLSGTWNTTGTPVGLLMDITNTASNVNSSIFDFRISGTSVLRLRTDGSLNGSSYIFSAGSLSNDLTTGTVGAAPTSGTSANISSSRTFFPSSGNATFTAIRYIGTINQTGGANGITRGLHISPAITAAADWRSIEWSNNTGWGLYGVGTAPSYFAGNVQIGSTTPIAANIRLQVTGTGQINDTRTYVSGTAISFATVKDLTINSAISGSSGIINNANTGLNIIGASISVPSSTTFSNLFAYNQYQFSSAGLTLTATQPGTTGIRTISQITTQNVFTGTNSGTITHVSSLQLNGFYNNNTGTSTPVITNAYQLLINDTGEFAHTFSFTNRWAIYQPGINDRNYLAGNLLLNSTVDTGQILQVNGAIRVNGQASGTAGGASGNHLIINVDGTQYKIALLNP